MYCCRPSRMSQKCGCCVLRSYLLRKECDARFVVFRSGGASHRRTIGGRKNRTRVHSGAVSPINWAFQMARSSRLCSFNAMPSVHRVPPSQQPSTAAVHPWCQDNSFRWQDHPFWPRIKRMGENPRAQVASCLGESVLPLAKFNFYFRETHPSGMTQTTARRTYMCRLLLWARFFLPERTATSICSALSHSKEPPSDL